MGVVEEVLGLILAITALKKVVEYMLARKTPLRCEDPTALCKGAALGVGLPSVMAEAVLEPDLLEGLPTNAVLKVLQHTDSLIF